MAKRSSNPRDFEDEVRSVAADYHKIDPNELSTRLIAVALDLSAEQDGDYARARLRLLKRVRDRERYVRRLQHSVLELREMAIDAAPGYRVSRAKDGSGWQVEHQNTNRDSRSLIFGLDSEADALAALLWLCGRGPLPQGWRVIRHGKGSAMLHHNPEAVPGMICVDPIIDNTGWRPPELFPQGEPES